MTKSFAESQKLPLQVSNLSKSNRLKEEISQILNKNPVQSKYLEDHPFMKQQERSLIKEEECSEFSKDDENEDIAIPQKHARSVENSPDRGETFFNSSLKQFGIKHREQRMLDQPLKKAKAINRNTYFDSNMNAHFNEDSFERELDTMA